MSDAVATTGILVQRGKGTPAGVAITTSAIGNPGEFTTSAPHSLAIGDIVRVAGHTDTVDADVVNGWHVVDTVPTATTFTLVGVEITDAGAGGTVQNEEFDTIAEITSVTPPQFSRDKIPTTTHNEGRESNVLGILLQSDAGVRINFVGTKQSHQDVLDDVLLNRRKSWRILFPAESGVVLTAQGRLGRFAFADAPVNAAQQADLSIVWAEPIHISLPAAV